MILIKVLSSISNKHLASAGCLFFSLLVFWFISTPLHSQENPVINSQLQIEPDSLSADENDSLVIEEDVAVEESDSLNTSEDENIPETNWTFDLGSSYRTKQVQKGVVNNNGKPVLVNSIEISHDFGFNLGLDATKEIGTKRYVDNWSFNLGYDYSWTNWMSTSASYSKTDYTKDTTNIFSSANNNFSFALDFMIDKLLIDFSYDLLFGNDRFNYFGLALMRSFKFFDDFKVIPMFSLQYAYYTLNIKDATSVLSEAKIKKLLKNYKGNKKDFTITESGFSDASLSLKFAYNLGKGFELYFSPSLNYTLMDLSAKTTVQFIGSVGINYSLDF